MHAIIPLAAVHTAKGAHIPGALAAAIVACIAAAVIVLVLKGFARLLTPRKAKGGTRSATPYTTARR